MLTDTVSLRSGAVLIRTFSTTLAVVSITSMRCVQRGGRGDRRGDHLQRPRQGVYRPRPSRRALQGAGAGQQTRSIAGRRLNPAVIGWIQTQLSQDEGGWAMPSTSLVPRPDRLAERRS
jgi:hypothetical protein